MVFKIPNIDGPKSMELKRNYRIQLFNDLNNENCDIGKKKTKSKGSS